MTRKDYVLIAEAISKSCAAPGYAERARFVVLDIADALASDNPRFDRERFLNAAGVQS